MTWQLDTRDSTNKPIKVGDRVRYRGREYEIAEFFPGRGRGGCCTIAFTEPTHTERVPADEWAVDLVT